jgi:hypothetical protein
LTPFKLGNVPPIITVNSAMSDDTLTLEIESRSKLIIDSFKLTNCHFDASNRYLDFSETSFDPLSTGEKRREMILLDKPIETVSSIGDFSTREKT